MNKAFVRESEEPEYRRCPSCGSIGQAVGPATLERYVAEGARGRLGSEVCFCGKRECEVAYFDTMGQVIDRGELSRGAWPKDASAPVCTCLGLSEGKIVGDAAAGDASRVKQVLAAAALDPMRCRASHPAGRACTADVQRLYLANRRT